MKHFLQWLALSALLLSSSALGTGVAGTDANNNGIRDDVDAYIQADTLSPAQRTASEEYARLLQRLVVGTPPVTSTGRDPLLALLESGRPDWADLARELRARTVNTGQRLNAYAQALAGAGPRFMPLLPAGSEDCPNGQCTVLIFQNGILNSEETALKSMLALRRLMGESIGNQRLYYALNYNPTEGLRDVVEVFRQKFGEQDSGAAVFAASFGEPSDLSSVATSLLTKKVNAAVKVPTTVTGWLQALSNPTSVLPQSQNLVPSPTEVSAALRDYTETYLNSLVQATLRLRDRTSATHYMDQNALRLTDGVEAYLRQGLHVVLVAHSQGNLYAEVVARELTRRSVPTERFAVVGISVPNAQAPMGGAYVSTQADLILGALRLVFPVLQANDDSVPMGQPGGAFLGHAFVDVYTNPSYKVSQKVAEAIRQTVEQVSGR
ncbi:hypothetical protein [Deinococcus sp. QL22]|uniref:hypothetical protein n=1 Tax=Deinococcus sp. QL22 TaxID=2939437 RepID=UPI0020177C4C|nr:hypothetical protein [Deinococcus sp. QL22]UQN10020.1 hypothetical protein M1R55_26800 [Deinococcus sp. QL22]